VREILLGGVDIRNRAVSFEPGQTIADVVARLEPGADGRHGDRGCQIP
jgi:hypothetical protein